jgi:membrane peptidoglycan carboxypeptidase
MILSAGVVVALLAGISFVAIRVTRLSRELPPQEALRAEYGRSRVALTGLPPHVYLTVLAAEDPGFFERDTQSCLSFRHGPIRNRLASFLMTPKRRPWFDRVAFRELFLIRMCRALSADELLELYLGRASFAPGSVGLDEAARRQFHRPVAALNLAEAAYLAAAVRNPARYSLCADRAAAKQRQTFVLDRLVGLGWANATTVAPAESAPPPLARGCPP